MTTIVYIPLVNPNEPEAVLVGLHAAEGDLVKAGDLLCTLETTKATAEVFAEQTGFVRGLRVLPGESVHAGDILCYLATEKDWKAPQLPEEVKSPDATLPDGLRITQPALRLARQHNLNLDDLPQDLLVTEHMIADLIQVESGPSASPVIELPHPSIGPQAMIVYGGGGHGKALIELLNALGTYKLVGVVDDSRPVGESILGLPVLGDGEVLPDLAAKGIQLAVNAVGGIGNVTIRQRVFERLEQAGFTCPTVIHPSAIVEPSARLSPGVQVFPLAYVGSAVNVGFGTIINTGAIVSHECLLGALVNVSPGAILAGEVQIGDLSLIGMGATLNLQVHVGSGARIGNGATVKQDVPDRAIVRAGTLWPPD